MNDTPRLPYYVELAKAFAHMIIRHASHDTTVPPHDELSEMRGVDSSDNAHQHAKLGIHVAAPSSPISYFHTVYDGLTGEVQSVGGRFVKPAGTATSPQAAKPDPA